MVHGLLSLPATETKVRIDWACAWTAGSATTSVTAAAMTMRDIGMSSGVALSARSARKGKSNLGAAPDSERL